MALRKHVKTKISKLKKGNFFRRSYEKSEPIYRFLGKKRQYDDNGNFKRWVWVVRDVIDNDEFYTSYDIDVIRL